MNDYYRKRLIKATEGITGINIDELYLLLNANNIKFTTIKEFFISCYTHNTTNLEEIFKLYYKYREKGNGVTLEKHIIKYGVKVGTEKFNSYCDKQRETNSLKYKQEKYGMTESEFNAYNKSRAITLENMILRHGDVLGKEKWADYCKKQAHSGCSLEYFIEKYGVIDGEKKYNDVCASKIHNYDNYIKWYGKIEGPIKFEEHITFKSPSYASKTSQVFFDKLYEKLDNTDKNCCYYHNKNIEFGLMCKDTKTYKKYDFCLPNKKIIIEYNGDHIHANPEIYSPNDIPKYFRKKERYTAQEIWDKDIIKHNIANTHGYKVYVVWESAAKKNIDKEINKLMDIINDI